MLHHFMRNTELMEVFDFPGFSGTGQINHAGTIDMVILIRYI